MASAVQTSLGKADSAYQKPSGGIPASDLENGVIPSVPSPSDSTPQALGTAAAGSSGNYSRADHVHQKPTYSKSDVGLGNVANELQYSANNPPPYPVTSVNGNTGAVTVSVPSISTSTPNMDGVGSAGSTGEVADAGHTHPSDTSKANQAQLAYVESGTTASRAYAIGEYFCLGGQLCRAKTAISQGDTFTLNTNYKVSNVGDVLTKLDIPYGQVTLAGMLSMRYYGVCSCDIYGNFYGKTITVSAAKYYDGNGAHDFTVTISNQGYYIEIQTTSELPTRHFAVTAIIS